MSDRQQQFRVGVVALATMLIAALLVSLNSSLPISFGQATFPLRIRVDRAPGVGQNTPVRKDGVLVGRVVGTEILPTGGVVITANIEEDALIYNTDACRIQPSSLFGDAVINFSYAGDPTPARRRIEPNALVAGAALPDPIEALTSLQVEFGPAIGSIGEAANGVAELTNRINVALGEDIDQQRISGMLTQANEAMIQFSQTMEQMSETLAYANDLLADPVMRADLKKGLSDVPAFLTDARETLQSFDTVIDSAGRNLSNLEGLTAPLGERGPELSRLLISAIENLDLTLADTARFAQALNRGEGTIYRLVNDPALYDNMAVLITNANTVLARLNDTIKDLRPVVYDARVFMDKIAREPGRIVGGALNQGPGLK
ncbi:hypothetical protein Mal64_37620 [Pseudobythopirellula maris]|uniref:Mce/MlaD domain-containing protein n=1 Tax=Pseudobythopirellula maris TaxID=2527991 RepID=A0A5C5ZHT6_9BACT|nr:MlaD family protein [Pseudobythopirellula maris]TWT86932.1 hypothetical protein Mal64_37620 [Pseudobythopirellula maris]